MVRPPPVQLFVKPDGIVKITVAAIERHRPSRDSRNQRARRDFGDLGFIGRNENHDLMAQPRRRAKLCIDIGPDAAA